MRRGFTLVELLMVMAIIAILAGLVVAVIPMVQRATKRNRTEAILETVRTGLSLGAAASGGAASPVPHPLAGSALMSSTVPVAQRSQFIRGETVTGLAGTVASVGAAVAVNGEALIAADPTRVQASPNFLLPSDRYQGGATSADCDAPMIYGVERSRLGILGAAVGLIRYRRIAVGPNSDANGDGVADLPYTSARYRDAQCLLQIPGDLANQTQFESEAKRALDVALGGEQALAELAAMGAVKRSDQASGALISRQRLRATSEVRDAPQVKHDDGSWQRYRLRGPALYDAWGNEILYWQLATGQSIFASAGPDGHFRWKPPAFGQFATAAEASAPAGTDRDAEGDNIISGAD